MNEPLPDMPSENICETEQYPGHVLEGLQGMDRYNDWIVAQFASKLSGRSVEIGVGFGSMAERLRQHVDSLDLIEPAPSLAAILREKFTADKGYTVVEQSLEKWVIDETTGTYDSVIMINVLEHIEDDIAAARQLYEKIEPGGYFFVFVPAHPFLYSELDRVYGHFRRYTKTSLLKSVRAGGFNVEHIKYFDISGVVPWWFFNKVLGKTAFNPGLLKIYGALVVPITRAVERLVMPPFGKNLVLIARKPH